jgi:hypothetical protein
MILSNTEPDAIVMVHYAATKESMSRFNSVAPFLGLVGGQELAGHFVQHALQISRDEKTALPSATYQTDSKYLRRIFSLRRHHNGHFSASFKLRLAMGGADGNGKANPHNDRRGSSGLQERA